MSELIAYHEADHALMAVLLGGKVKQVTIEPDDDDEPDRQGDTQVLWRRSGISDDEFVKIAVQVSLTGLVESVDEVESSAILTQFQDFGYLL